VAGRNRTEEVIPMTELPGGVKTLAIRLPDELHAQLVLVAQLDGVSLAEAIRSSIEQSIARRRDNGDLAGQAQAALDQMERDADIRRAALQALLGPDTPAKTPPEKPASRRRSEEPPA